MKFAKITLLFVIFSMVSAFAQNSYNYEEMTEEVYVAELQKWQDRLTNADQGIADEDARIARLQQELDGLNAEIDQCWTDIYAKCGSDGAGNQAFGDELGQLRGDVNSVLSLSAEDIYGRMNELDDLQARLDALKENDLSVVSANEQLINQIQSLIDQAREKGKGAVPPSYTVTRGDYLWKIAANPDIYNDAYAWIRIYSSNSDQIKDPDLIFPDQTFLIPRVVGPNEHLVQRGENLSMIAGYSNVYGSTFQWNKLYEANKTSISDPNVVYPHQVIQIAR
ncbi:MAG: LysM peptidoglycan-binding domain-containing protein [Calditrichaeota bacterium]|nr:MAG: LysM peptidoglycan-binding domain-containing protein [Calditrichota bacterium]MBL1206714.1 LysM peptidoglycan-binding domain-containing protein [Calditrichota bacterium]NOG46540.1 LysM peptidoglycan-binding domain-containing protein [Calditrichota bacterium]